LEKYDIMILGGNDGLALGFGAQTFETILGHMGKRVGLIVLICFPTRWKAIQQFDTQFRVYQLETLAEGNIVSYKQVELCFEVVTQSS
jgi:hypothetical protein